MRPAAVLFDCDGVVVDSEPITDQLIQRDLAKAGLEIPVGEVHHLFIGGTMRSVYETARGMGAALPDDWLEDFNARLFDVLAKEVKAVAGIANVLDALDAAEIPYAIGSNGPMAKMDVTLRATGLYESFAPHIYTAHDCPKPKPAPDVYLHAARQLGVDPAHCVVIEDSPAGAKAGQAAGARVFGYTERTPAGVLAGLVAESFDSMAELPGLLQIQ